MSGTPLAAGVLAKLLANSPVRLQASASLAACLRPFWPEVSFVRGRAVDGVAKLQPCARPPHSAVLFRPGLLRPPRRAGLVSSATVATGNGRTLGDAAADASLDAVCLARGAKMAARLAAALAACGDGPPVHVLAAGPCPAHDVAQLRRLLTAAAAAEIVVVAERTSPLAHAARQAGCGSASPADDLWPLAGRATAIHAAPGTDLALLGLLAGCPVFHLGQRLPALDPARAVAGHLIVGTRYVDPHSRQPVTCEGALDQVEEWRHLAAKLPRVGSMAGIAFWKRRRMADLLGAPAFARTAQAAVATARSSGGGIAVWPSRAPAGLDSLAAHAGVPVWRIEDGFIRSAGLGADFIPPCSVVIDRRGIYYDPRQPSDLEHILAETAFEPALLARAERLIDLLVRRQVTKYGLTDSGPAVALPAGRRILVPGQVADDQSVAAGGGGIAPGLDLLRRVRRANPGAVILYKPHPDVDAGHRRGAVPDPAALQHADQVVRGRAMASLLGLVDEVHTLTSLAGFEALLRGRTVVTYGQPFYAGWGLTMDLNAPARRTRRLSLAELVAGVLILYPHYIDPLTCLPCGPERLIESLTHQKRQPPGAMVLGRRLQGLLRRQIIRAGWAA